MLLVGPAKGRPKKCNNYATKTMYFTMFRTFGKGEAAKQRMYFTYFRAFGTGEAANNHICYIVFAPSEKAKRPNTLYFAVCWRLGNRRGRQKLCVLQCFAPSKPARRLNTLYFAMFSRLENRRSGQQPCILQGVRARG